MGIKKSVTKRYNWISKVKFDKKTGFSKYTLLGKEVFIRNFKHFVEESQTVWNCENIYYHYYLPKADETIIDLGAGYGEETVYLHNKSPKVNFYGVEIQPVIFECLSNTLHGLGKNFSCTSLAISDMDEILLSSNFGYEEVGDIPEAGYIKVPCISWENYLQKNDIKTIDLFKMNIEGAEKYMLEAISDFSRIKRFIISCHDFRANSGDGEHFRTKQDVLKVLKENNYEIKTFNYGKVWTEDWIYAEQKN